MEKGWGGGATGIGGGDGRLYNGAGWGDYRGLMYIDVEPTGARNYRVWRGVLCCALAAECSLII